jgi:hypothetical protein
MKIALSELDWAHFSLWIGIIAAVLLVFLSVLAFLDYHKK